MPVSFAHFDWCTALCLPHYLSVLQSQTPAWFHGFVAAQTPSDHSVHTQASGHLCPVPPQPVLTQPVPRAQSCRALVLRHLLFVCCQCISALACKVPQAVSVLRRERVCPRPSSQQGSARLLGSSANTSAFGLRTALCVVPVLGKTPTHVKFSSLIAGLEDSFN